MYDMSSLIDCMIAIGYLIIVAAISIPIIIWTLVYIIKFIVWLIKNDKF